MMTRLLLLLLLNIYTTNATTNETSIFFANHNNRRIELEKADSNKYNNKRSINLVEAYLNENIVYIDFHQASSIEIQINSIENHATIYSSIHSNANYLVIDLSTKDTGKYTLEIKVNDSWYIGILDLSD